jgi:hypothetical protein
LGPRLRVAGSGVAMTVQRGNDGRTRGMTTRYGDVIPRGKLRGRRLGRSRATHEARRAATWAPACAGATTATWAPAAVYPFAKLRAGPGERGARPGIRGFIDGPKTLDSRFRGNDDVCILPSVGSGLAEMHPSTGSGWSGNYCVCRRRIRTSTRSAPPEDRRRCCCSVCTSSGLSSAL